MWGRQQLEVRPGVCVVVENEAGRIAAEKHGVLCPCNVMCPSRPQSAAGETALLPTVIVHPLSQPSPLQVVLGNEHISFATTKLGSLLQVQSSKDPEGLRVFYYLVQVRLAVWLRAGWLGCELEPKSMAWQGGWMDLVVIACGAGRGAHAPSFPSNPPVIYPSHRAHSPWLCVSGPFD